MHFLRRLWSTPAMPDREAVLATKPVNIHNPVAGPSRHLCYGQASDVGQSRQNNQDACVAFATSHCPDHLDFGLFVVADGMGGHLDGEKASSLSARVVAERVTQRAYLPMLLNDASPDWLAILDESILAANDAVTEQMPNGGTTMTAVLIHDDQAYISQVGDSRAYLIDDYSMQALTRDHSLVQRLVELQQLTPEQAAVHPHRNILYRAIGQSEHLELDSQVITLNPTTRILLCSDGLWTVVPETYILDTVTNAPNLQAACDALVEAANRKGGPDNITVILVQLKHQINVFESGQQVK
jgi:protein phosphatase